MVMADDEYFFGSLIERDVDELGEFIKLWSFVTGNVAILVGVNFLEAGTNKGYLSALYGLTHYRSGSS